MKTNGHCTGSLLLVLILSLCDSVPNYQIYPNSTISDRVMTLCKFFKMASIPSQVYFRFPVLWHLTFRKVKSYWHTKFQSDISIQFRVWPFYRHRYVILHRPTKFIRIRRSATEQWRHIDFQRWRPYCRKLLPFSGLVTSHVSEGTKLFAYQISTKYLNPRLRYYYFRLTLWSPSCKINTTS